ncbi:phage tail sheath family protein [Leptolyngbyaceae cyanobacterium UHCC 1019]
MPEYLAPGVYVEETSFRSKSIEGVGTSTTAFVGLTLKGPAGITPDLLTSFSDFERVYGGLNDINGKPNYIAHSVRAYFDNGGSRLYVSRVLASGAEARSDNLLPSGEKKTTALFKSRFEGEGGNGKISLIQKESPTSKQTLGNAPVGSILQVKETEKGTEKKYFLKQADTKQLDDWKAGDTALNQNDLNPPLPSGVSPLPPLPLPPTLDLITVTVVVRDPNGTEVIYDDLGLDARHPRYIGTALAMSPQRRSDFISNPFALVINPGDPTAPSSTSVNALELRAAIFGATSLREITLTGGTNGSDPTVGGYKSALQALEALEDVAIVAAPGHSAYSEELFLAVQQELLNHVSRRKAYRVAILDTPKDANLTQAKAVRSRIDSTYAALYYPWVVVANPLAKPGDVAHSELALPPSGFVAGIYARNDVERGVYKAPANEIVRGALRFETDINFAQQEVLNPLGINCLRFFSGRGYRVWGARTVSSDPEWKYINVRRYFVYLEASIDRNTQWAVFEPNGMSLWTNIRDTISAFLYNEWLSGALLGSTPQEAFFVRCDRSTMTQNDLDNGRLICLIGVAVIKPAEFVIFRIGQTTVEARS